MIGILGATGKIGTPLVELLAPRGIPFRALAHTEKSADFLGSRGAIVFRGDAAEPSTLRSFLRGVDQLFLLTASRPDQIEVENQIIDLAREADVKGVVKVSVYTVEPVAPSAFCVWHWSNEQHLKQSGLPYTILQCHTFMESIGMLYANEIRATGRMSAAVQPDRKLTIVHASDVAEVAAAFLQRDLQKSETLLVAGATAYSHSDCAQMISQHLGRKIEYTQISADEMTARFISNGVPEWLARAIVGVYIMYDMDRWPAAPVSQVIQEVCGHPPRTFDDYLDANAGLFG